MKKLLILGQIPKEYGGSYTTGVANVIIEIANILKESYDTNIYATNLNSYKPIKHHDITFLGYSKKLLLKLLFFELIKRPIGAIKELRNYKNEFGVPQYKFLLYRILIKNYIKELQPDIINAHGMMFSPIMKHLKLSKKTYFSFHGFMHNDPNSILANQERGISMQKLYKNGAKYVFNPTYLNPEMKDIGETELKINSDNASIISNGVNVSTFKYSELDRELVRREMGVLDGDKVFISVGALTHRKNHLGFIEFLKRNLFKGSYWIIGKVESEETRDKILHLVNSKELPFTIKLFSYMPNSELYRYYSASDVYAHPSTSEGQALVVFEAMCCGMPVLVNKEIKGTIGLDNSYDKYLQFVDLKNDDIPSFIVNRTQLSEKCKEELSWEVTAKKYVRFFGNNS
ncbi:glycosyltransferase family 4 protein [Aquimarina mytili]|uniref:Glycosyltransferase family 4 protein n=1 Tax=Aquimarina mytili TaxID=874423 RepID=A0A937D6Q2_9FLAO|nr:glycosyltransferase family 4 protein [Aquimarina mytili]MBL0684669.1 glycosyltransferase family 4 protein [Aquimarina mytili]